MKCAWLVLLLVARVAYADDPPPQTEPGSEPAKPEAPPPPKEEEQPPPPQQTFDKPVLKSPIGPHEIVVDIPRVRSRTNQITLLSLAAATVAFGGLGLYYHVQSRSESDDVSATQFTGIAWTGARQAKLADAHTDRRDAAILYSIGGAALTTAIVLFIVTEPGSDRTVIHPHHASISPAPGGAVVGGTWSW